MGQLQKIQCTYLGNTRTIREGGGERERERERERNRRNI
jgi:hypothetical protein